MLARMQLFFFLLLFFQKSKENFISFITRALEDWPQQKNTSVGQSSFDWWNKNTLTKPQNHKKMKVQGKKKQQHMTQNTLSVLGLCNEIKNWFTILIIIYKHKADATKELSYTEVEYPPVTELISWDVSRMELWDGTPLGYTTCALIQ